MALHLFKTCYSIYMLAWVKTKHATRAGDHSLTAVWYSRIKKQHLH